MYTKTTIASQTRGDGTGGLTSVISEDLFFSAVKVTAIWADEFGERKDKINMHYIDIPHTQ